MQIKLANPRGFCAGVDRAIEIVERALELFGAPLYVKHEVVHNKFVVEDMIARGVIFIEDIDEVPDGVPCIFSAHGVSLEVRSQAKEKNLKVFDATCPLVTKVHFEVKKYSKEGCECILIGHQGHPEVEGTIGQFDASNGGNMYLVENVQDVIDLEVSQSERIAYVTQTTLSMDDTASVIDALREKYPKIKGPQKNDICYATQNRQDAVKQLAIEADIVLVVGSSNSSNSNRLKELAENCGCKSYLIDGPDNIKSDWFFENCVVGLTAGASAPESIVDQVIECLVSLGASPPVSKESNNENVYFSIPKELRA
tara:strand:- start:2327 stop:3262 length:936 start_codon:yes stop_codon:yes gene_type:complete